MLKYGTSTDKSFLYLACICKQISLPLRIESKCAQARGTDTSALSELSTRAAAVMKSLTNMVKPGMPRKKKRGEHHLIIVFSTS